MSVTVSHFEPTGQPALSALAAARVELHWAAQVPAAAGATLLPHAADDSHTSLEWLATARVLASGRTLSGERAALRPADLTLLVLDASDSIAGELALAGRTLDEALAWAGAALGAPDGRALVRPAHDLPDHPVAHGARFDGADRGALAELARWYASGDEILRAFAATTPGASPVRCWPHHFDIATLVQLDRPDRTLGVGLSTGDGSFAEPYFYASPWPSPPERATLTAVALPAGGCWHAGGWFGAALTATALCGAVAAPAERAPAVAAFVAAAFRAMKDL